MKEHSLTKARPNEKKYMSKSKTFKKSVVACATLSLLVMGTTIPAHANSLHDSTSVEKTQNVNIPHKLTVTNADGSETFEFDSPVKLGEALKSRGLNPDNYRTKDGKPLDLLVSLNSSILYIYGKDFDVSTETITMKAPVEEKENPELPEGETKVITEGQDGEAIKTTTLVKNIATGIVNKEEKLTVTKKPVKRVVEKGTKKAPEPTQETEPENTLNVTEEEASSRNYTRETFSDSSTQFSLPSSSGSALRDAVVANALSKVGSAYVWGASGNGGYDCSGLVLSAFASQGVSLPRTARAQGSSSQPISWNDLQPGDILWDSGHIGIYVGNGQMVHASNETRGVVVDPVEWYTYMQPGRIL